MTFRLSIIKAAVIVAVLLMLVGTVTAAAADKLGDVDGDGKVTLVDASFIQRKLSGMRLDGDFSDSAADVDGNGAVEITDATLIQRWLVGIETPYPIGEQPTEPPTEAPTQRPTDSEGWGRDIYRP